MKTCRVFRVWTQPRRGLFARLFRRPPTPAYPKMDFLTYFHARLEVTVIGAFTGERMWIEEVEGNPLECPDFVAGMSVEDNLARSREIDERGTDYYGTKFVAALDR